LFIKLLVSSGEYQEIIKFKINDRQIAHRMGCLRAIKSGKPLGRIIRTSTHLDTEVPQEDDLFSSTELVEELLGK